VSRLLVVNRWTGPLTPRVPSPGNNCVIQKHLNLPLVLGRLVTRVFPGAGTSATRSENWEEVRDTGLANNLMLEPEAVAEGFAYLHSQPR
jgi:hypothetical protein